MRYYHSKNFCHFFSCLNKWFLLTNRKVTLSTLPEGGLGRGRYSKRQNCWWKVNKPLVGSEGKKRISWSERGKRLLGIIGEREGKLLKRSLVSYLKGINWLWGMSEMKMLEFWAIAFLYVVRALPSSFFIYHFIYCTSHSTISFIGEERRSKLLWNYKPLKNLKRWLRC